MTSNDHWAGTEKSVATLIDATEEMQSPLKTLVAKTGADPNTPIAPDRAAPDVLLRAQVQKVASRVAAFDGAVAEGTSERNGRGPKQADILIDLAQSAELFHAPDGISFADLVINRHRETWPIRGSGFRRWLVHRFFETTQSAPNSQALQSALNVIEAKPHFDAPERMVNIRVGGLDGRLYLDLGDMAWRAVEIDAAGWRVIKTPPVRFRRAAGMQPLPVPETRGSIETLRSFLNVQSDADFVLVVAWVLAALRKRPLPRLGSSGRARIGQVNLCCHPAVADRSKHSALTRSATRGSGSVYRSHQRSCAGV